MLCAPTSTVITNSHTAQAITVRRAVRCTGDGMPQRNVEHADGQKKPQEHPEHAVVVPETQEIEMGEHAPPRFGAARPIPADVEGAAHVGDQSLVEGEPGRDGPELPTS